MTTEPDLNDPYRVDDLYRANHPSPHPERDLQMDPELAERPSSGGKIALFALGIALVLGAVFYGLNSSSTRLSGTGSTAQNTAPTTLPVAPPGMRDVTPRANTAPGTTTGAAPSQTAPPPAARGATNNK